MTSSARLSRVMAVASLLVTLLAMCMARPNDAQAAYNCWDRCYGTAEWVGGTTGAYAQIGVVHVNYNNGQSEFINSAVWLSDFSSALCVDMGACWIEAGYKVSNGARRYYWGDQRPGYPYTRHLLSPFWSADYGNPVNISISKASSSVYTVEIVPAGGYPGTQYSSSNPMQADRITIGQELRGTDGGYAPETYWRYNQWRDSAGNFHYQTAYPAYFDIDNPPYAHWQTFPTTPGSQGGTWLARCC